MSYTVHTQMGEISVRNNVCVYIHIQNNVCVYIHMESETIQQFIS